MTATVPPRWLLWLSLLGAPLLWLVHFLLAYLFTEATCSLAFRGGAATKGVLVVGSLPFVLGSLAFTLLAYRVGQRAERSEPVFDDFLPKVGVPMGLLFTLVILLEGASVMFLEPC